MNISRGERGQALSVLVLLWTMALVILAGLVVDGGRQVAAARRAEAVAAAAARAGADAAATSRLGGRHDPGAAVLAAREMVASDASIQATVSLPAGRVRVETSTSTSTVFLSLIGIGRLTARGEAEAELVAS